MAMTEEKVKKAFDTCLEYLTDQMPPKAVRDESGGPAKVGDNGEYADEVFQHLAFVCEEGKRLIDQGRREKAMRWLGFMQGCLWMGLGVPLDELKKMNMPEVPDGEQEEGARTS